MNAYPLIPPLGPREVKELCRQIRVLRGDYPHFSDEELAAEWAEQQAWMAKAGKPSPFADWVATGDWESGFKRALAFSGRQIQQKQRAKAMRREVKDRRMDREPATPRQQRFVKRLAEKQGATLPAPAEQLSKLAASKLIDQFLEASSEASRRDAAR